MKITERQVMQLIRIALDYRSKIELAISMGTAEGEPEKLIQSIDQLINYITNQQSHVVFETQKFN